MSAASQIVLQVNGLTKHFPVRRSKEVVHAVNGISFEIHAGQTLALVGESGSGKTTVGRCVLKLIEPTAGQILFNGQEITSLNQRAFRSYRSQIQMVFQEPYASLNPRMSVGQIIEENLLLEGRLGNAQRKKRVYELLNMVSLEEHSYVAYPHELTGGQQQRVAIARALSTNPDLVVLDEPTSELDISVRADIIRLLRDLQEELGTAYLFISHDLTAVKEISHEVAIMYLGEIVETAPNPDIFEAQLHPYGQALLSSVLFPDPDAVHSAVTLQGEIPSPIDLPSGCHLHPRCPYAEDKCKVEHPELRSFHGGRRAACHFAEQFLPDASCSSNMGRRVVDLS